MRGLKYNYLTDLPVIYVGIAGRPTSRVRSLRYRDYKIHFSGDARRSTLRKSLGVLFGFRKVFSEKSVRSTKYKFNPEDEGTLSEWMKTNLTLHFLQMEEPLIAEQFLINYFNPPLNLKDNHNKTNSDFRKKLSELRTVWISANVRDEHRQAMEWLNENTSSNLAFFAVQVELLPLSWERLDHRKSSRIAKLKDVTSYDDNNLEALKKWALEYLQKFRSVFGEKVKGL